MAPVLGTEVVSLPPDDSYPFYITAKRYISPTFGDDPEAFTLILLHSTSFFKEAWEPTLEDLVDCVSSHPIRLVREAWAIECPNHGASAELNESILQLPEHRHSFTCEKYALAVHRFLLAGPSKGAKVDFLRRNIIGIGHSLGGVAIAILSSLQPRIPLRSIILIEPMLSPGGREYLEELRYGLVRSAYERHDVWPDRKRALRYLKDRDRTKLWDPRMLQSFIRYGLREHPGAKFADTPYRGVTLCCSRDEEAAMYRDVEGPTKPVIYLNETCSRLPVHVIFGATNDYIPQTVHDALIDSSSPRRFASISRVEKAGHLVPQCAPKALANVISQILMQETNNCVGGKTALMGSKL
ncbi:hypothetical protein ACEPAI_6546 [Sanghuangporus weigelae]